MTQAEIELLNAVLTKSNTVSRSRPRKQRPTHFNNAKGENTTHHQYRNKTTGLNTFQILTSEMNSIGGIKTSTQREGSSLMQASSALGGSIDSSTGDRKVLKAETRYGTVAFTAGNSISSYNDGLINGPSMQTYSIHQKQQRSPRLAAKTAAADTYRKKIKGSPAIKMQLNDGRGRSTKRSKLRRTAPASDIVQSQ